MILMDFLAQPVNLIITIVLLSFAGTLGLYIAVLRSLQSLERSMREERIHTAKLTQKLEENLAALAMSGHAVRPSANYSAKTQGFQTSIKTPAEALTTVDTANTEQEDLATWNSDQLPDLAPLSEFTDLADKARSSATDQEDMPPVIETIDTTGSAFFPDILDEFASPESHFPANGSSLPATEVTILAALEEEYMEQSSPFDEEQSTGNSYSPISDISKNKKQNEFEELPHFMRNHNAAPAQIQETAVSSGAEQYETEPAPQGSKVIVLEDDDSPIPSLSDLLKAKSLARNSRMQPKAAAPDSFHEEPTPTTTTLPNVNESVGTPQPRGTAAAKIQAKSSNTSKLGNLPTEGKTDIFDSLPDTDPEAQPLTLPNLSLPKENKKGIHRLGSLEIKIGK